MRFGNIYALYALIAIPFIWCILFILFVRKHTLLSRWAESKLWPSITAIATPEWTAIRNITYSFGLILIIIALSMPQWGKVPEEQTSLGMDITFLLDCSNSMSAQDVAPSRLLRAKLFIKDLVSNLKTDRVALIPFAGTAFILCPQTTDYGAFSLFLDLCEPSLLPSQGTDISEAIKVGITAYPDKKQRIKAMVLISDGEDLEGKGIEEAKKASREGAMVFCIGIGNPSGEMIPVINREGQVVDFKKGPDGKPVLSRLDETTLKAIADATKGKYFNLSHGQNEEEIRNAIFTLPRSKFRQKMRDQYREHFQIFLLAGIMLLGLSFLVPDGRTR